MEQLLASSHGSGIWAEEAFPVAACLLPGGHAVERSSHSGSVASSVPTLRSHLIPARRKLRELERWLSTWVQSPTLKHDSLQPSVTSLRDSNTLVWPPQALYKSHTQIEYPIHIKIDR